MLHKEKNYALGLTLKPVVAGLLALGLAGTANAADIYKKDGLTYKVKADWQIQLKQDVGEDQNLDIEFDDLELKNTIIYDLADNLKAFGQLDFSFDSAADREEATGNTRLEEAFLGFIIGDTKISFGKTNTAGDEFGVEKAYEKVGIPEDGFEEIADKGDDLIRVDAKLGNVYLASSTELEAEGEGSADDSSLVDIFAQVKFAGAKVAAAYMDYQAGPDADSVEVSGFSVSYGPFGVDYSTIDQPDGGADADIYNVVAGFKVAPTTKVGLGINDIDSDNDSDDASGWYANATYQFPAQKNVSVFFEVGDNDKDDVEPGYLLGMRIKL